MAFNGQISVCHTDEHVLTVGRHPELYFYNAFSKNKRRPCWKMHEYHVTLLLERSLFRISGGPAPIFTLCRWFPVYLKLIQLIKKG
jgi:hypothetical protein